MKIPVVPIGNSKGLRIPASVLKKMGQPEYFELVEEAGSLRLQPAKNRRADWEAAFQTGRETNIPSSNIPVEPWY
jgi:antitoxin MazE